MKDILVQQGLTKMLKGQAGKLEKMSDEDWVEFEAKCVSAVRLCIALLIMLLMMILSR